MQSASASAVDDVKMQVERLQVRSRVKSV
jgi:hypothetical protein